MRLRAATLLTIVLPAATAAIAGDHFIPAPAGWYLEPASAIVSIREGAVAFAARPSPSGPAVNASRVVITRGEESSGTTLEVELPGKVWALDLSPTATHLLAQHQVSESDNRVSLIGETGAVLWTRQDTRVYSFSSDGTALLALPAADGLGYVGEIEIFGLAGETTKKIEFGVPTPTGTVSSHTAGALLIGDGSECIVAPASTVLRLKTQTNDVLWKAEPTFFDPRPTALRWAGPHIILDMEAGRFKVFNAAGELRYSYIPNRLGLQAQNESPPREPTHFASYDPFDYDANTLFLFNRTSKAYTLDLLTGAMTPRVVDVSGPPGFVVRYEAPYRTLLLVGSSGVIVRGVSF